MRAVSLLWSSTTGGCPSRIPSAGRMACIPGTGLSARVGGRGQSCGGQQGQGVEGSGEGHRAGCAYLVSLCQRWHLGSGTGDSQQGPSNTPRRWGPQAGVRTRWGTSQGGGDTGLLTRTAKCKELVQFCNPTCCLLESAAWRNGPKAREPPAPVVRRAPHT